MPPEDYSIADILGVEVIDESPDSVLVEFANGDVNVISKHSVHGALCSVSIDPRRTIVATGRAFLSEANFETGGTGMEVTFELPGDSETGYIIPGDLDDVRITGADLANVLLELAPTIQRECEDGTGSIDGRLDSHQTTSLFDRYEEIIASRVREYVVREVYDALSHNTVEKTEAGREQEFRDADRAVFWDTHNDDNTRWGQINNTSGNAPCPPEVYERLKSVHGPRGR